MTTTSPLVQRAIVATASAMDADVDLFGVPVDLAGRAVVFVSAPIRMVVKIDANIERAQNEASALADLADSVPVPTVWFSQLLSEPNHQHWVTGTSFCDGDRLANSAQQSAWVDAGAVVRSWHSTDVQNWPTHGSHPDKVDQWVAQISDRAQEIGLINTSVAKAFSQAASFSSPSNRKAFPIHGDLTEDCVFHDGTEVSGLVNLGDSGIGDPAYDIATLTLWRPDQVEAVVSGYGTIAETDDFETDLRKFRLIRLLVGAEWLHTQGFSPAPYLSELYERLLAG